MGEQAGRGTHVEAAEPGRLRSVPERPSCSGPADRGPPALAGLAASWGLKSLIAPAQAGDVPFCTLSRDGAVTVAALRPGPHANRLETR